MDFRTHAPLILLTLGFALGACTPYPPPNDPYGGSAARAPRYGHGGTESPRNPNYSWEQQQRQLQQQAQANQNQTSAPDGGAQTTAGGAVGSDTPSDATVATDDRPNRTSGDKKEGSNTNTASKPSSSTGKLKYGTPVPGKSGFLYSPHNPDGGYIDIRVENADGTMGTLPPGTKIKDPFSSEPILVP